MNEERKFQPPAVGGSSLLVIFAVLCLTIFALLCLSTVQANGRLSNVSAQAVSRYYMADTEAEKILAQIRAGQLPEGVTESISPEGTVYAYVCPLSDTQELAVEVRIDANSKNYTILRWETVFIAEWEPDTTLDLWNGDPVTDLGT